MKKIIILLFTLSLAFFSFGCQKNQGDEFFTEGSEAYAEGDYETALEKFESALEAGISDKISYSDLYAYLGGAELELGNLEKAQEYYQSALDEDDTDVRNYVNLAITYRQGGR